MNNAVNKVVNMNKLAGLIGLALASAGACAQNTTIAIGGAHIRVADKSASLSSNGPAFLTPQPAGLDVDDANTVIITVTRKINDNWDAELALGIPPKHKVKGTGTLAPYGVVSEVKQAAPTAFLNYNFGGAGDALRPFVGVGVNFTRFYDATSTDSGSLASGGPTKITLKNSTGMAAQLGAKYKFNSTWSACISLATAKVESELTATTGSIARKTTIDFNPSVLSMSLGYSF